MAQTRRTARSLWGSLALLLGALATASPALADATPRRVEIEATGDPPTMAAVEALVRELVGPLPVEVHWVEVPRIDPHEVLEPAPRSEGAVARAWIDLSDTTQARVFVTNEARDRFLVRVVPGEVGHLEVEEEAVAQIVGFAVEALLAGAEIGMAREDAARQILAEPNAPPPSPKKPERDVREGLSGEIGAFVGVRTLGAGSGASVDPGVVAMARASAQGSVRPLLLLELHYQAPVDLPGDSVSVRLQGVGGNLQGGVEARLGSRVAVRAVAGLGGEALYAQPLVASGSSFTARGPFWLGAGVATARLAVDVSVAAPVSVFASAGCDLDMSGIRFPVTTGGSIETNVVPWRVWPLAQLGVTVSFGDDFRGLR